jgi:hypothetical protein
MLVEFPPYFNETQKISDEDFVEIIEYNIPPSWRASMVVQGFEPVNHTLAEIIEFCEKMKYSEGMTRAQNAHNQQKGQYARNSDPNGCDDNTGTLLSAKPSPGGSEKKRRTRHTSHAESGGNDGCALHVNATDHTTGECRVLLSQAKKMRAVWEAQPKDTMQSKRQKVAYNNNKNNNNNYKANKQGDFHTLLDQVARVKSSLKRAIKQQGSTIGKRKSREQAEDQVSFGEKSDDENSNNASFDPDSFHMDLDQISISENDHFHVDEETRE